MSAKGHRYPWASAVEDIAMDLAERTPTEEEFRRLWSLLGEVVRYLVTHDVHPESTTADATIIHVERVP